jgi:hypothetical protein
MNSAPAVSQSVQFYKQNLSSGQCFVSHSTSKRKQPNFLTFVNTPKAFRLRPTPSVLLHLFYAKQRISSSVSMPVSLFYFKKRFVPIRLAVNSESFPAQFSPPSISIYYPKTLDVLPK